MPRKPNKDALDVVTNILDATNTKIGPQNAAINTLKRRGWTDEQIKASVERYKAEWPRLDWVSHPIDREAIRTVAGDETDTVKAYLMGIGTTRKQQAKGWANQSPKTMEGNDNRRMIEDARRIILAGWQVDRQPSVRGLARAIEKETGIPYETVRGHLKKMG